MQLTWTSDKPTQPGWYWTSKDDGHTAMQDVRDDGGRLWLGNGRCGWIDCLDDTWRFAGPIPEPVVPPPDAMTPDEREAQRRSFAYGNAAIDNPNVTREMVDQAAEAVKSEPRYITCAMGEQATTTELLSGRVFADFDKDGKLLGVEILDTIEFATNGISAVPDPTTVAAAEADIDAGRVTPAEELAADSARLVSEAAAKATARTGVTMEEYARHFASPAPSRPAPATERETKPFNAHDLAAAKEIAEKLLCIHGAQLKGWETEAIARIIERHVAPDRAESSDQRQILDAVKAAGLIVQKIDHAYIIINEPRDTALAERDAATQRVAELDRVLVDADDYLQHQLCCPATFDPNTKTVEAMRAACKCRLRDLNDRITALMLPDNPPDRVTTISAERDALQARVDEAEGQIKELKDQIYDDSSHGL